MITETDLKKERRRAEEVLRSNFNLLQRKGKVEEAVQLCHKVIQKINTYTGYYLGGKK